MNMPTENDGHEERSPRADLPDSRPPRDIRDSRRSQRLGARRTITERLEGKLYRSMVFASDRSEGVSQLPLAG